MPRLFEGEALTRLQSCWGRAQASAREQWEEAKAFGVLPEPLDGIYYANQAELNTQFPDIGSAGFGRKWFDIPRKDFWKEAEQADGDDSLLGLTNPPKLMEVLDAICGGAGDEVRCVGIQPRTVPPDDEGGYIAWHRTPTPAPSEEESLTAALLCKR